MAVIQPFCAVRPVPTLAAQVASLPYDVMNTTEAKAMAGGNPYSFLHVSRAEIDLPEGTDEHSQAVYDKANENFRQLISSGTLFQEEKPCYYIYAQTMNGRRQIGLVASSSVEDYFNEAIKKHEFTRPEKEEDRIRHMETLSAHVGPFFLTYPKNNVIDSVVTNIVNSETSVYDFTPEDGVRHTVWLMNKEEDIALVTTTFQEQIPFTYIADGHHRTASAAKVGQRLKAQNPKHTGKEEYNFFLSVLFPDEQLAIMDYNRLIKDLNGHSEEEFLNAIAEKFELTKSNLVEVKPNKLHQFGMYLKGQWYQLSAKAENIKTDPIGVLDVTILQENVLAPLLGINDPRTDKRIDFVGGIRGLQELERRVNKSEAAVAFALYPVSLKQLMDIADSGNVMPPKSTWFEPKLRDGLFSHLF